MAERSRRASRRDASPKLTGFGALKQFDEDMRIVSESSSAVARRRVFTMGGVYRRLIVIGALTILDMLAQSWWVMSSRNVGWDPWWLGVFGVDSGGFDAVSLVAGVLGVAPAIGVALMLPVFLLSRVKWLFYVMMVAFVGGIARLLGTGLGRTMLYVRGVRDGVYSNYSSGVATTLDVSDTVAGSWPAVVAGVVFTVAALAFALVRRPGNASASKPVVGGGAAVTVGLVGIVLVERGWAPVSGLLLAAAVGLAWLWLPGEVRQARQCAVQGVDASWMWHAASLIWLETLLVFAAIMVALAGF